MPFLYQLDDIDFIVGDYAASWTQLAPDHTSAGSNLAQRPDTALPPLIPAPISRPTNLIGARNTRSIQFNSSRNSATYQQARQFILDAIFPSIRGLGLGIGGSSPALHTETTSETSSTVPDESLTEDLRRRYSLVNAIAISSPQLSLEERRQRILSVVYASEVGTPNEEGSAQPSATGRQQVASGNRERDGSDRNERREDGGLGTAERTTWRD